MIQELTFTAGDRLSSVRGVFPVHGGIAGCTVKLVVDRSAKGQPLLEKTATITDAEAGEFRFDWDEGDLTEGTWPAVIQFFDTDGKRLTFGHFRLNVGRDISA